jgi:ribulose-phosphate 3-epimerase
MIIPTVFVKKGGDFKSRFDLVSSLSTKFQIDIMDGKFVPAYSVSTSELPDVSMFDVEAHLMVAHPKNYVVQLIKKGFSRIMFHYESQTSDLDVQYMLAFIRTTGATPVLVLNPDTPVEKIFPIIDRLSHVMLMGVVPGLEHQEFIADTVKRVKQLKKKKPSMLVQVDGGATPESVAALTKAGCDHINVGSYVATALIPKVALDELRGIHGEE